MERRVSRARERVSRLLGIAGLLAVAGLAGRAVGCGGAAFQEAPGDGGSTEDAGQGADTSPPHDGATTPDDATADAGHPKKDAAPVSDDGGDATTPADGGGGMGSADSGDGAPSPFCSSYPGALFCSDFDTITTAPYGWASDPSTPPNATFGLDATEFVSAPNGFIASNTLIAMGNANLASLGKVLTSSAEHIDYSFAMFVTSNDTINAREVPFAQLMVGEEGASASTTNLAIDLILKAGSLEVSQSFTGDDGGPEVQTIGISTLPTKTWVKLEILLDRAATGWTATIYQDAVSKIDLQIAVTPSNANLEVDLGILEVVPPTTANSFTFDNVLVRAY